MHIISRTMRLAFCMLILCALGGCAVTPTVYKRAFQSYMYGPEVFGVSVIREKNKVEHKYLIIRYTFDYNWSIGWKYYYFALPWDNKDSMSQIKYHGTKRDPDAIILDMSEQQRKDICQFRFSKESAKLGEKLARRGKYLAVNTQASGISSSIGVGHGYNIAMIPYWGPESGIPLKCDAWAKDLSIKSRFDVLLLPDYLYRFRTEQAKSIALSIPMFPVAIAADVVMTPLHVIHMFRAIQATG